MVIAQSPNEAPPNCYIAWIMTWQPVRCETWLCFTLVTMDMLDFFATII